MHNNDRRPCCTTAAVALVDGVHHVTFLTADLDRLVAFYERVFDVGRRSTWSRRACDTSFSRSGR
jgi:hypothetical protein